MPSNKRRPQLPNPRRKQVGESQQEQGPESIPTAREKHSLSSLLLMHEYFLESPPTDNQLVLPHHFFAENPTGNFDRRYVHIEADPQHHFRYSFTEEVVQSGSHPPYEVTNIHLFENVDTGDFLNHLGNPEFTNIMQGSTQLRPFLNRVTEHAATIDILTNGVEPRHWLHLQRSILEFTIFDIYCELNPDVIKALHQLHKTPDMKFSSFLLQIAEVADQIIRLFLEQFPRFTEVIGKQFQTILDELSEKLLIEKLIDEDLEIPMDILANDPGAITRVLATRAAQIQAGRDFDEKENYKYIALGIRGEQPFSDTVSSNPIEIPDDTISAREYANALILYEDTVLATHLPRTMETTEKHLATISDISNYHVRRMVLTRGFNPLGKLGLASLLSSIDGERAWFNGPSIKGNFGIAQKAVRDTKIRAYPPDRSSDVDPAMLFETALMARELQHGDFTNIPTRLRQDLEQFPARANSVVTEALAAFSVAFEGRIDSVHDILRSQIGLNETDFNNFVWELMHYPRPKSIESYVYIHAYSADGKPLKIYSQTSSFTDFFGFDSNPALHFKNYVEGIRQRIIQDGTPDPVIYAAIHINHNQVAQEQITLRDFVVDNIRTQPMYKASR